MPDFVPLHRGDRWRPTASEINAFRAAALAHALSNGRGKTPARTIPPNSGVVTVVNTSGSLVERGGVLGIDSPVIMPDENADEFARLVLLNGVAPVAGTHEGKFVVTLQSIPDGQSGLAVIAGVATVQVDIQTEGDAFCDIADGDTAKLKSGTGSARILWAASGTGTQWAVVLIGGGPGGPSSTPHDLSYTNEHSEAAATDDGYDPASPPADTDGVKLTIITGVAYYDAGDETLYCYARDLTLPAWLAPFLSEERRVSVDVPEECP